MNIRNYHSLLDLNTFKVNVNAEFYINIQSEKDLLEILKNTSHKKIFILGGGSNILLTRNIKGLVIHNQIKGIKIKAETNKHTIIEVGAGELWDRVVEWSTERNLYGIENLSLIPGYIGAAPIQNIGAYGTEIKDVFQELKAINLQTKEIHVFNKSDCQFGYRDSIFKNKLKDKLIITKITIKLSKQNTLNLSYKAIKKEIEKINHKQLTSKDIREIIIKIRKQKLPDPQYIGNAGSFFKNPIVNQNTLNEIKKVHPDVPVFKNTNQIKIPAGWLIEKLNWKGYKENNCGVYNKHSLVLINYGNASGKDIVNLSQKIKKDVNQKFNIKLEEEVSII